MACILLVDDDPGILNVLKTVLMSVGHDVVTSEDAESAMSLLPLYPFELMISDIRLRRMDGIQLMKHVHREKPHIEIIIITAYASLETAVETAREGAFDYIIKPFRVQDILNSVNHALQHQAKSSDSGMLQRMELNYRYDNFVADSPAMAQICNLIEQIGPVKTPVLIVGEEGSGKISVAHAIHENSPTCNNTFLTFDCRNRDENSVEIDLLGALRGTRGLSQDRLGIFERAKGGTVCLHHIENLPPSAQVLLLKILQDRQLLRIGSTEKIPLDFRIIATSRPDLDSFIEKGLFREDLFRRLSVLTVEVPPLCKRVQDIIPLTYHVIRMEFGLDMDIVSIEQEVKYILEHYAWPGNVRELEDVIRDALSQSKERKLTRDTLPDALVASVASSPPTPEEQADESTSHRGEHLRKFLRTKQNDFIRQILAEVDGDLAAASKRLRMTVNEIQKRQTEFGSAR